MAELSSAIPGFIPFGVQRARPLDFDQFLAVVRGGDGHLVPVELHGHIHDEAGRPQPHVMKFEVSFSHRVPFYALVPGGILPPSILGLTHTSIALDRNVIIGLRRWRDQGATDAGWKAAVECLNQAGVPSSPFIGAFEGGFQRVPTFEEFCRELDDIEEITRQLLPALDVLDSRAPELRQRMYTVCVNVGRRGQDETQFLKRVAPLLKDRAPADRLPSIQRELLASARALGLEVGSFPVLAALVRLYESHDGSDGGPAQGVMKFRDPYPDEVAHNALADLHQLEVLAASVTRQPSPALLTADKKLALLWAGLRVFSARFNERGVPDIKYSPHRRLFARLSDEGYAALGATLAGTS